MGQRGAALVRGGAGVAGWTGPACQSRGGKHDRELAWWGGAGRAGRGGGSGALDWARHELLWAAGERTGPRWAEEKGERLGRIGLSARLGCGEKE